MRKFTFGFSLSLAVLSGVFVEHAFVPSTPTTLQHSPDLIIALVSIVVAILIGLVAVND